MAHSPARARRPGTAKPNTFDPRSRSSTLRAAKIRAKKFGTTFMWATALYGFTMSGHRPAFNQAHIRIERNGSVTQHGAKLPARTASV